MNQREEDREKERREPEEGAGRKRREEQASSRRDGEGGDKKASPEKEGSGEGGKEWKGESVRDKSRAILEAWEKKTNELSSKYRSDGTGKGERRSRGKRRRRRFKKGRAGGRMGEKERTAQGPPQKYAPGGMAERREEAARGPVKEKAPDDKAVGRAARRGRGTRKGPRPFYAKGVKKKHVVEIEPFGAGLIPGIEEGAPPDNGKVSVIISAKNEGEGISHVIKEVRNFADEILVIDGHSTDNTCEIAKSLHVRLVKDHGRGKGDAVKTGIEEARGEFLVFIDADGSHVAADIPKMVEPLKNGQAELVIGSRIMGGSDEFYMTFDSLIRQVGSDIITWLTNLRWKVKLTDIENGFRAIRKKTAQELRLKANDFDIEQEMVMKCLKKKKKILEVPSHENSRKWGRSKLSTLKGWRFVWRFIKEML